MEPDPPASAADVAMTPEAGRLVHIESADAFRTLLDSAGGTPPSAGTGLPSAWISSSYSRDTVGRLVVAYLSDGSALLSWAGNGRTIHVPRHEWYAFRDGVKDGEFDGPVVPLPGRPAAGDSDGTPGGGAVDGCPE